MQVSAPLWSSLIQITWSHPGLPADTKTAVRVSNELCVEEISRSLWQCQTRFHNQFQSTCRLHLQVATV